MDARPNQVVISEKSQNNGGSDGPGPAARLVNFHDSARVGPSMSYPPVYDPGMIGPREVGFSLLVVRKRDGGGDAGDR